MLDNVFIKMKYDKSQCGKHDSLPIAVTITNNTNKKIYRVKYDIGKFQENWSLDEAHKKENYDNQHRTFRILKPNDSHVDCVYVPRTWYDDVILIEDSNGNKITTEDQRKKIKEQDNKKSIYRALYRDVIFSDGEKVSGYSDMDNILLDKYND